MRPISRRATLLGLSTLPLAALPLIALERQVGFSFRFEFDGQIFNCALTAHTGEANLITISSNNGRFREAVLVPWQRSQATSVAITGAGRRAEVVLNGRELEMRGAGLRFHGVANHPSQGGGEPQTQGLFGNIMNSIGNALGAIGDVLEAIAVGVAAGLAWLVGAEFSADFFGGRASIYVGSDGTIVGIYGTGGGFMPPPEGTDEDPGVWY